MAEPTHLDAAGHVRMVDVSQKKETSRQAVAACRVHLSEEAAEALRTGRAAKGDVAAAARVAGILATKKTSDLIPLCHPVRTTRVGVELRMAGPRTLEILAEVSAVDRTGVEMEALTAASVAALTVYDMLKSVDRAITVTDLRLLSKSGGKSGAWRREES